MLFQFVSISTFRSLLAQAVPQPPDPYWEGKLLDDTSLLSILHLDLVFLLDLLLLVLFKLLIVAFLLDISPLQNIDFLLSPISSSIVIVVFTFASKTTLWEKRNAEKNSVQRQSDIWDDKSINTFFHYPLMICDMWVYGRFVRMWQLEVI